VQKIDEPGEPMYGSSGGYYYRSEYGIPDPRPLPELQVESNLIRTFPVFRKVIDVRWKGGGKWPGLKTSLDSDQLSKDFIMKTGQSEVKQSNFSDRLEKIIATLD
jgi:hypothetical protein